MGDYVYAHLSLVPKKMMTKHICQLREFRLKKKMLGPVISSDKLSFIRRDHRPDCLLLETANENINYLAIGQIIDITLLAGNNVINVNLPKLFL